MSADAPGGVPSTTDALQDQASAASILVGCNAALRTFKIHSSDNAAIERPLESLLTNVQSLIERRGKAVIAQVEGVFYLGDARLKLGGSHQGIADLFATELTKRQLGGFSFTDVPDKQELIRFFGVLNDQSHGDVDADKIRQALRANSVKNIQVSKPLKAVTESQENQSTQEKASHVYCAAIEHAASMYRDLSVEAKERNLRPGNVRSQRIVQELVDVAAGDPAMILSLAGLRGSGDEDAEHSICVAVLAIALAKRLGLSKTVLADVGLAAVYHDQGLQLLPPSEQDDYDKHPVLAIKTLIGRANPDPRLLRQVVVSFEHHLDANLQGGHPKLQFKKRLHPISQMIRLANDFDGMTRGRHGAKPLSVEETVRSMMKGAGDRYHPALLRVFLEMVGGLDDEGDIPVAELVEVEPRAADPIPDLSKVASLEEMAAALAGLDTTPPPAQAPAAAPPRPPPAKPKGKKPQKVLGALKLKRIKA